MAKKIKLYFLICTTSQDLEEDFDILQFEGLAIDDYEEEAFISKIAALEAASELPDALLVETSAYVSELQFLGNDRVYAFNSIDPEEMDDIRVLHYGEEETLPSLHTA